MHFLLGFGDGQFGMCAISHSGNLDLISHRKHKLCFLFASAANCEL